jgi:hypothetical protein
LAAKAGVGLHFVRELEQGKPTLQLDKVNTVLRLFARAYGPFSSDFLNMRSVEVYLHGKLAGHQVQDEEGCTYTPQHQQAEFA